MRVLMTADTVGGVWTHAVELSRVLARRGHEILLATMGPPPDDAQRRAAAHATLLVSSFRLEWQDAPWTDVESAGAWLLALKRAHEPDVVHLTSYAHAALPWRAPTLVVAHSDVATWWLGVHGTLPPPAWDAYRQRIARGLASADLVLAPTRAMLDALRQAYAFRTPALVVPNGLAPRPVPPLPKGPRVLAVGRVWDAAKDIATLDAAADGLPWPVEVAGEARHPDGAAVAPLRAARALGRLRDADLAAAYARASILAHPARYEAFGLVPLEAARAGCALVLSDLPTLREVWGDAARYARPGDADDLRARLRELVEDDGLRAGMAGRAAARAARYTADAMADGYLAAYARLARSAQGGTPSAS